VAKEIVSDEKDKPVLNEEILGKLLEAAWVLQEHNRAQQRVDLNLELHSEQLREEQQASLVTEPSAQAFSAHSDISSPSKPEDYTFTLAKIVETQHQIQLRQLDLESSMAMVLDRLINITKSSGAAVGLLDKKIVRYRAVIGQSALPRGAEVEKERALCWDCLRSGQVTRCPDVISEFLLDVEECRRRGIQSLIAVPVYHDGEVVGALELYFDHAQAFGDSDVHSCQLMAGLVTEALAREEELNWKKSLAEERSVMLDALEKIKPDLAALADEQTRATGAMAGFGTATAPAQSYVCSVCGEILVSGEQYCGTCGSPRDSEPASPPELTKEIGSTVALPAFPHQESLFTPQPHETGNKTSLDRVGDPFSETEKTEEEEKEKEIEAELAGESTALTKTDEHQTWTSAAKAKDFLEQLATEKKEGAFGRFWMARRGDAYLAVAVILVAIVVRWGIWSERSVSATGTATPSASAHHQQSDPDADLTLLDKMLISIGLADPPEAPENKGNPNTQVWIDLHTALYYCPGADLYGKTAGGRYTSQRDAQLDQFEPAYRKACE
jgi:GAF domain-containing protein